MQIFAHSASILEQKKEAAVRDLSPQYLSSSFKAVIFDFDGTLADSGDVWQGVDRDFFAARNLPYDDRYAEKLALLGFKDGAQYTIETYGLSETVEELCAEWNAMGVERYRTGVDLRPHAADYINSVKSLGIPVSLATTNDPEVIGAMEHRCSIKELLPIRVFGREVANSNKDKPDIYLEACRRMGVSPQDCVVFEDLPAAILTAKSIGITTCGVFTGRPDQNTARLVEEATYCIESWQELLG
ncbi:MAG: HAD family phosphatase [Coriobacteriales bacterium]|nr:HAD family phosphatase [Coriobacteriales bacterium]